MAAQTGNGSSGGDIAAARLAACQRAYGGPQVTGPPPVIDYVTVALIPPVRASLQQLQDKTSLSQTDIFNRAVTLYEFVAAQLSAGREFLIRDGSTGEIQRVIIT
jgi:hypothetical protein